MSKVRLFLVPITSRCWAMHVNTLHQLKPLPSNNVNGDFVEGKSDLYDQYPPRHLNINYIPILKNIKSKRVRSFIQNTLDESHNLWVECEEKSMIEPITWKDRLKGNLYRYTESVLQRIDGYESFLASVPYKEMVNDNDSLTLMYIMPTVLNSNDASMHIDAVSKYRIGYHKKWLYLNMSLLPFTSLLGLLPGPNVFVLWNGYRCYCHYKAYYGAIAIDKRKADFTITYDDHLDNIYNNLVNEKQKEITDDDLHQLQSKYDCEHIYHHLHRIRYQIVGLQKYSRYQLITQ